jgi:hypothetical protein
MKKAKQSQYAAVCAELGVRADVRFVEITSAGSISFTCGKPEECRALAYAARQAGYTVSRALDKASKR